MACIGPLSEADRNRLGWELTRLSALSIKPVMQAIAEGRRLGGQASGASRRDDAAARNTAICEAGRRLIKDGKAEREVVGILSGASSGGSNAWGLTGKTIRKILRAGGVLGPKDKE